MWRNAGGGSGCCCYRCYCFIDGVICDASIRGRTFPLRKTQTVDNEPYFSLLPASQSSFLSRDKRLEGPGFSFHAILSTVRAAQIFLPLHIEPNTTICIPLCLFFLSAAFLPRIRTCRRSSLAFIPLFFSSISSLPPPPLLLAFFLLFFFIFLPSWASNVIRLETFESSKRPWCFSRLAFI